MLRFRYHGNGLWNHTSLEGVVAHLDDLGYTCFFETASHVFLLSRCWSPAFEVKLWSNVLCVTRVRCQRFFAALCAARAICLSLLASQSAPEILQAVLNETMLQPRTYL